MLLLRAPTHNICPKLIFLEVVSSAIQQGAPIHPGRCVQLAKRLLLASKNGLDLSTFIALIEAMGK